MYTDSMRKAFHSIVPPENFSIIVIDNDHFITLKLDEHKFLKMVHDEKMEALKYVVKIKKCTRTRGAIVLVTREAIK
jgi:hypothetical protein